MTENLFAATFVRGQRYIIAGRGTKGGDLDIERGQTVIISEELKEYLDEAAVDEVAGKIDEETGEREVLRKPKFEFETYKGELPLGATLRKSQPVEERALKGRRVQKAA